MQTTTDYALYWRDQGISPVPVVWRHKFPSVPWKVWADKLPPPLLVKAWFESRRSNLGLVLDHKLTVLDFDQPAPYVVWKERNKSLAKTYTVRTGRGVHVYFELALEATRRMKGGEIKASGIIVAPPSVHHTGKQYEVMHDLKILQVEDIQELGVQVMVEPTPVILPRPTGSSSVIEHIKSTIPILEYLQQFCKPFRTGPKIWMAICPFHDDRKPSLAIYPHENLCYCFGSGCRANRKTDVINVCMYAYNLSLKEAIRRLLAEA